jgi:hypothetical protein
VCSKPVVFFGEQSKSGKDTVYEVRVRWQVEDGWEVHHRLGTGLVAEREFQYTMRDTSDQNKRQWRGMSRKYLGFSMIGEVKLNHKTGELAYMEWLYDARGALKMNSGALCRDASGEPEVPASAFAPTR